MGRRSTRSRQATDSTERDRNHGRQSRSDRSRTTRAEAQHRYGLDVEDDADLLRLRRLEEQFGQRQVRAWQQEGIPLQAMGDADAIGRYRERTDTPVPWNVEEHNEHSVQRSTEAAADATPAGETRVPDAVRDVITSRGQALDASIQRAMEERMGDSLGDVRIHTGPRAAQACEDVNARAFTVGNHVAFDAGEYDPSSPEGQHVLAHELAHVRQQTGGALSMLPKEELELEIDPDPELEREAEQTAQRVMAGGELGVQRLANTEVHVQRSGAGMFTHWARTGEGPIEQLRSDAGAAHDSIVDRGYGALPSSLIDRYEQRQEELTPAIDDLDDDDGIPEFVDSVEDDIETLYAEVRKDDLLTRIGEAGTAEALKMGMTELGKESPVPFGERIGAITGAALQTLFANRQQILEYLGIKEEATSVDADKTGDDHDPTGVRGD